MSWNYFEISDYSEMKTIFEEDYVHPGYYDNSIIYKIFSAMSYPVTILIDDEYLEENYVDLFSNYYVHSYRNKNRFSERWVIFSGIISTSSNNLPIIWFELTENELSSRLLADISIWHTARENIGIAYVSPQLMLPDVDQKTMMISKRSIFVRGKSLNIYSFPYMQLDGGPLSCAEVSILNLLNFYNSLKTGIRKVLPSDVLKAKKELSDHLVSSIKGMSAHEISKVIQNEGLQTIAYMKSVFDAEYSPISKEQLVWRKMFSYIDSGYPCLVLTSYQGDPYGGHCVNGIGLIRNPELDFDLIAIHEYPVGDSLTCQIINEADISTELIVMDEREFVVTIDSKSTEKKYSIEGCIITLPREVVLFEDAARTIAEHAIWLIYNYDTESYLCNEPLIMKTCLAKAEDYMAQRIKESISLEEKELYSEMRLPKYVWICEFTTEELRKKGRIIGEMLIDATSINIDIMQSVIMARIANYYMYNDDEQNEDWTAIKTTFVPEMKAYRASHVCEIGLIN